MKKLLGIVVLGFGLIILNSCATTYESFQNEATNKGYKYTAMACPANDPRSQEGCGLGGHNNQKAANEGALKMCHEEFSKCVVVKEGNRWVYTKQDYDTEQNSIKMASMIDKAKNTCKSLGFNEGTEKFTDCSLKLYTQEMELAAKQNQQVIIQGQNSGSMTIYDPVRDSENMMRRGMGLVNGTCTLANYYSC